MLFWPFSLKEGRADIPLTWSEFVDHVTITQRDRRHANGRNITYTLAELATLRLDIIAYGRAHLRACALREDAASTTSSTGSSGIYQIRVVHAPKGMAFAPVAPPAAPAPTTSAAVLPPLDHGARLGS